MKQWRSSSLGYPRIGERREWKKALEAFWEGSLSENELLTEMKEQRFSHINKQKEKGIDLIPVGDFSLYDHVLDTAFMFGLIPDRFKSETGTDDLATYFAMARGSKEAVACEMTKWFNTNYHYIVPEIDHFAPRVAHNQLLDYFLEAKNELHVKTKPVILGPLTLVKLAKGYQENDFASCVRQLIPHYMQVFKDLEEAGAEWIQVDEPVVSTSISDEEVELLKEVYHEITSGLSNVKLLLQSYFEAVDRYEEIINLPVDGIGFDFVHDEGANFAQLKKFGFPKEKVLAAGMIDGRNVWKADLNDRFEYLEKLAECVDSDQLIIQPSCSLLHTPVTIETEDSLPPLLKGALAFADEKLEEVTILTKGLNEGKASIEPVIDDQWRQLDALKQSEERNRGDVKQEVSDWNTRTPGRKLPYSRRKKVHEEFFRLPLLPATTIGSLPQTKEIRQARSKWRKGDWGNEEYKEFIERNISEWVSCQETIGLDVLVHGEFERNDMVEFFGEKLGGFAFTRFGWVQSYGSRCVKPPVVYGDVYWKEPMTVEEIAFAQSLTDKPLKGMLTGPVTITNWSFVRNDVSKFDVNRQIALALQKEIHALEERDIHMIQVDEPALREGLPLKVEKQAKYLAEAVYAFKLTTTLAKDETQIHTHMCYSNFNDIMDTIDQLDADVISIEAARSHGGLVAAFENDHYDKGIGLGVYDIHSPRIPPVEEMEKSITRALQVLDPEQFWVNPDCGLKTRNIKETVESLKNMTEAARLKREEIKLTNSTKAR
ncbi:5-methyltetrahydropteroyltriglutamate--homocysteine S-methyltransferase [Halobacillus salinarum]|uniref:5-methyltetrahydropteroyltriglutamate--homocysteine methyltransferase n=1 Tax=Halobacillus salinarum TaxID=2932257 RepID=A0ABY4EP16_9BACI|nr:5-methyltetrahydropteroyltriglutamate--homocysteine S-methyltransferase [Halobacillus salinarum]UOQ45826.1 5-methyltetrahydropteroyltriglutamate--homocysteine S-methyltransferase [Halobacillus salinarum]